jgi:hypothetical protein
MNGSAHKQHLYGFMFDGKPLPDPPGQPVGDAPFARIRVFVLCRDPFEAQRRIEAKLSEDHWQVLKMVEALEIDGSTVTEPIDLALLEEARRHGIALSAVPRK